MILYVRLSNVNHFIRNHALSIWSSDFNIIIITTAASVAVVVILVVVRSMPLETMSVGHSNLGWHTYVSAVVGSFNAHMSSRACSGKIRASVVIYNLIFVFRLC